MYIRKLGAESKTIEEAKQAAAWSFEKLSLFFNNSNDICCLNKFGRFFKSTFKKEEKEKPSKGVDFLNLSLNILLEAKIVGS